MNIFPRLSALFLVSFASATLFACSAPTSGSDDAEVTAATAEPLVESYEAADVTANEQNLRLRDDHAASPVAVGEGFRGTWATDPNAFVLCTDQHCVQAQKSVTSGER
jgi:hypothetical protein